MNLMKAYNKSCTFFSRNSQEKIVRMLEHKFYECILPSTGNMPHATQIQQKMKKISHEIQNNMSYYYFEDDLLEYLFNMLTFTENYIQNLEEKHSPLSC